MAANANLIKLTLQYCNRRPLPTEAHTPLTPHPSSWLNRLRRSSLWDHRWQSLRVVIALTVVAGIVLASLIAYLEQSSRFREDHAVQIEQALARLTDLTALALREPLWQFAPEQADSIIEAAFVNPDVISIVVWDSGGIPFATRQRSDKAATSSTTATRSIARDAVVVGKITIQMSTAGYERLLVSARRQYLRSGLLIGVPALVVILLLLHWRLVRPLNTLVRASKRIQNGQLDTPIRQVYPDEVGELAQSLEATRLALVELVAELEHRNQALVQSNETLEQRVAERTQSLQTALATLERAQQEIVKTEKLASLGRVVAGVAHELNTPIGNALTVVSTIQFDLHALREQVVGGTLRRSTMDHYAERADEGLSMAVSNLQRAASLIADFKQVSVDQSSDQRRAFGLSEVSREVLNMLTPALRQAGCELDCAFEDGLPCDGFPGRYAQVLTNIVMNSVKHAFTPGTTGKIMVRTTAHDAESVCLTVTDNGVGMDEDTRQRVFDPFFTTKMGRGGTGLGMNIVHSIVTRILGGQVTVTSKPGQGTKVEVVFSRVAPHATEEAVPPA